MHNKFKGNIKVSNNTFILDKSKYDNLGLVFVDINKKGDHILTVYNAYVSVWEGVVSQCVSKINQKILIYLTKILRPNQ